MTLDIPFVIFVPIFPISNSTNHSQSIRTAGNVNCPEYSISAAHDTSAPDYYSTAADAATFYQSIYDPTFTNVLVSTDLTYESAYPLYEYASYAVAHNATIESALSSSSLSHLRALASQQQFDMNGNLTSYVSTIAARTLAGKIIQLLQRNIFSGGVSTKLTILSGAFEPFLSFFALSSLNDLAPQFQTLPLPGSAMVFELFSLEESDDTNTTQYPDTSDLWVRFLFRNGTDTSAPLRSYPLFNRGQSSADMSWSDFLTSMETFAVTDVETWCTVCGGISVFCDAFSSNDSGDDLVSPISSGNSKKRALSAAQAGVIGAVVTLVVVLMVGGCAMAFGGLRLRKVEGKNRRRSLGGFKGAEKLGSDTDLAAAVKGDTRKGAGGGQERIGSWELGEHRGAKGQEAGKVVSYTTERDTESVFEGHETPVVIEDRV